ncbi:MAG: cupredoxin domain-containing protein [bacterium]
MSKQNIFIIISLVLVFVLIFFASSSRNNLGSNSQNSKDDTKVAAVQIVDGKQIIEVVARGGYNPRDVVAKANIPTILRMKTSGTFDCSAAFVIPSLGIQKMLPQTGVTDIEIPSQTSGSNIAGTCGMGMYRLNINFQ